MKKILASSLSLLFAGCAVGPNYKPPVDTVSSTWASEEKQVTTAEAPCIQWWNQFNDPLLNKYIALASEYNNDVLAATSHILQARALRQIAASSFFPHINADVNAARSYYSKNGPLFSSDASQGVVPGTISPTTGFSATPQTPQMQNLYNALFDASWEIDLFGKTRRTVEAADANIGTMIEQKNDVLVTVTAEIARNYMELRSTQKRKQLIAENISILEKKAQLIRKQFEVGYVSKLEDEQILATLASERALLPDLEAQIHRAIYTLSVLTGAVPETLLEELLPFKPLPIAPETVAVGLRSDLLRRRPDVRKTERQLAVATAAEGVAVASFFPTVTLFADGGFQSLLIKNLFSMGSKTWALGGDANLPIFEGGRLWGNLKAKRAETAIIAHTYQQVVLSALEESESAIASYTQALNTLKERKTEVGNYKEMVSLSTERNEKGLVSLINLLDTQRQFNTSEQTLLESQTATLLDLVSLYKALGGGWEILDTESPQVSPPENTVKKPEETAQPH